MLHPPILPPPPAPVVVSSPTQAVLDDTGHHKFVAGSSLDVSADYPKGRYTAVKLLGSGTYGRVVECKGELSSSTLLPLHFTESCAEAPVFFRLEVRYEYGDKACPAGNRRVSRSSATGDHHPSRLEAPCESTQTPKEFHSQWPHLHGVRHLRHESQVLHGMQVRGHSSPRSESRSGLIWLCPDHSRRRGGKEGLGLEEVRGIARELLDALEYVHSKSIIHTDIKTDNCLVRHTDDGRLATLLIDFGSAIYASQPKPPMIGTQEYRSVPTVLRAHIHALTKSDAPSHSSRTRRVGLKGQGSWCRGGRVYGCGSSFHGVGGVGCMVARLRNPTTMITAIYVLARSPRHAPACTRARAYTRTRARARACTRTAVRPSKYSVL